MAGKVKGPAPGEWQFTVGEPPHQLTAYERSDRGNAIYARVWDGNRYTEKRSLHPGIRDDQGDIDAELEQVARDMAIERQKAVAAGLDEDLDGPGGPLTLAQGFKRVLHPKEGKYAAGSEWRDDVERSANVIMDVLGRNLLWQQIRHAHYRKLWRHLAHENKKSGAYGARTAEVMVGVLQSAARWLQAEGWIEPGDALPAPSWKEILHKEWVDITGDPIEPPEKPRFTGEESEAIWTALPDRRVDPRLELVTEIGAELRLGQVARTRRSDIKEHGGFRFGAVRVHGRGKKLGALVVLTMHQRHVLTRALLWGYLADVEAAYQAGEIDDYFLIAGGYLHQDEDHRGRPVQRARPETAAEGHWHRSAMRKAWKELQEIAGVEDVKGRNWYGLRRRQADAAEDAEEDARVLNRLGAWKHTETREGYQEEGRTEIDERAKEARAKIRPNRKSRTDLTDANDGGDE